MALFKVRDLVTLTTDRFTSEDPTIDYGKQGVILAVFEKSDVDNTSEYEVEFFDEADGNSQLILTVREDELVLFSTDFPYSFENTSTQDSQGPIQAASDLYAPGVD